MVDLGSGAGFDVFQAAKKVGVEGKVWGVDMNDVSRQYLSLALHQKEKQWGRGERRKVSCGAAHKW